MTDPVETDALRAPTADDIREEIGWAETGPWTEINEAVKARVAARQEVFDRWLKAHDAAVADQVDRLRTVIENAPHGDSCLWPHGDAHPDAQGSFCDCWKADVL
ncbi:hypothetical protein [Curtobacterium sp. MCBA15_004]|uniref:hypothetical protein n=1 Tax=Curtobacterium sp. MCBA15_004 TaxID=1898733 RepID=UPI001114BAC4|nr:hypothetical protein [Curtobacterium sp. MCBA15_004]WIA95783.1 hypothetical protein QOL16_11755 [Curtobacterium sp. MCBA15_004]